MFSALRLRLQAGRGGKTLPSAAKSRISRAYEPRPAEVRFRSSAVCASHSISRSCSSRERQRRISGLNQNSVPVSVSRSVRSGSRRFRCRHSWVSSIRSSRSGRRPHRSAGSRMTERNTQQESGPALSEPPSRRLILRRVFPVRFLARFSRAAMRASQIGGRLRTRRVQRRSRCNRFSSRNNPAAIRNRAVRPIA